MKKGALSSTFERDVCPIRQIAPWEAPGSHLKAAPKRMSVLGAQCAKLGSHLEKSLSARFPRRVFKEKEGTRPAFSLRPRGQGHITLQPVAAVRGVFDDGVRLHERNQDVVAARLEEARREEHRIRLGSYGDHAACDEERHRHQEQVKRRGWQAQARNEAATAEADTRRDRRERSIQFAKYCEIIDSHNFASCFTPPERSEAR